MSTSDITLLPQSFSQYGGQERKEAARVVLHCWYTKPTKLLSESLDIFFFPYSLTCQQETLMVQINSWHQSDVTAWSLD